MWLHNYGDAVVRTHLYPSLPRFAPTVLGRHLSMRIYSHVEKKMLALGSEPLPP